ncbi:MAG: mucoidy inhibitor MuiA family protein [Saprospirales bacterium]|nr:mucoidy inhibitor MuiA family protein [Saprospirales bacterium]
MKTRIILLSALFLPFLLFSQTNPEKPVESKIDSVTVFLEGAQIHRSGQLEAPIGRSKWVLKGLSPFIDPQSIQIKTNSELILLSANHRLNFLEVEDKGAMQQEILSLQDSIQVINALVNTLAEEEQLLKANRSIGGSQTGIKPEDLQTVNTYYVERIKAIRLNTLAFQKRITAHNVRIQQLQNQLQQNKKDPEKASGEVVFELECKRAQKAQIVVSYIAGQAGWFPLYDIRAKDVNSDIELVYRARVHQSTGEDWKQVSLTFSNADPSASGALPDLQPWYLSFNQIYRQQPSAYYDINPGSGAGGQVNGRVMDRQTGEPLIGATIMVEGSTIGTVTDFDGNFILPVAPNGQMLKITYVGFSAVTQPAQPFVSVYMDSGVELSEMVVTAYSRGDKSMVAGANQSKSEKYTVPTTVIENQTNVSFRVDLPYTLQSDGEVYTVDLTSFFIPAYYEYQSVPKLDESAFLIARITDWDQYNLLEGEANLFFEDTYVGKSILDVRYLTDTLDISLGRDRNVLVKRTKVVDFARRRFIGANKVESRSWKLEVRNNKAQAINLLVYDQLPISKQNEIEVTAKELAGTQPNPDTGELRWSFNIEPRGKKEWTWGYEVKYPKDRELLLE